MKEIKLFGITIMTLSCPLCCSASVQPYLQDRQRAYFQCGCCQLVFADPASRLCAQLEKAEYDLHQNNPQDQGYRQFLLRLVEPLQQQLPAEAKGLDFGCGSGPTLSVMMAEAGWAMQLYDIFYYPDKAALQSRYDFITATEVVEHLHQPGEVLTQLWQQLNPGGYLALMTKLVIDPQAFARWHYKNDPTHVCFFSRSSFEFLARQWCAKLSFIAKDVIFLQKVDDGAMA